MIKLFIILSAFLACSLSAIGQRCNVEKQAEAALNQVTYVVRGSALSMPGPIMLAKSVTKSDTLYKAIVMVLDVKALPSDLNGITLMFEDGGKIESPAPVNVAQVGGQMSLGGSFTMSREDFARLAKQRVMMVKISAFISPVAGVKSEKIRKSAECLIDAW